MSVRGRCASLPMDIMATLRPRGMRSGTTSRNNLLLSCPSTFTVYQRTHSAVIANSVYHPWRCDGLTTGMVPPVLYDGALQDICTKSTSMAALGHLSAPAIRCGMVSSVSCEGTRARTKEHRDNTSILSEVVAHDGEAALLAHVHRRRR